MIGYIAQLAFGLRFLVQWLSSEKEGRSVTPKLFWQLSIVGNLLLLIHCLNQLYFPMSLVQSQNLILSWRNLNLQGAQSRRITITTVLFLLALGACATAGYFAYNASTSSWIAAPTMPNLFWGVHLFGIIGILCYCLRFWVQWWQAECRQNSELTESFWWISLVGASLCSIYFFIVEDWVNFIGPLFSLLPYSRNVFFMRKA